MSYPASTEQDHPRLTPAVRVLIAINVALTFLQLTVVPYSWMGSGSGSTAPHSRGAGGRL